MVRGGWCVVRGSGAWCVVSGEWWVVGGELEECMRVRVRASSKGASPLSYLSICLSIYLSINLYLYIACSKGASPLSIT